ncbi:methyltransferase [Actinoplanes sp. SE50]|uniref:methyltransferase domain-containing protein n=1 Tax=unclassified Actinoplanes TaxID=2626549 RepID=UPI00023ECBD5|nr:MULTISPECIES: methyltransferase domain-containing protein [unclassified Actinoplanes]AEV87709.1 Ubiquinone/menaquinone biosynthesis methyltransferase ubiE [Actinoplanes sp. SE50/110]ATO86112.1 methyltransferase [Actinoplanes sp. SE50]SLM03526.1 methyltransferase [Actinoplanes sp. SE50/110]
MEPAQQERTPFADIDGLTAPMTDLVLTALTEMGRHPEIRRVRRAGFDALRPAPGMRLLDAGSGSGEVARSLAAETGPRGEVIALDYSAAITAAAIARHDGGNVRYVTGDVGALELPDDCVDGVWCERVLQHVADPDAAVAELRRVTRPGGRLVLIDTDWDSLAFDGMPARLWAELSAYAARHFTPPQRDMGRTLRRRLVAAGLSGLTATPVTCLFGSPESAAVVLPMVNPRVPAETWQTPPGLREEWLSCVEAAGARGDFLAVLTIWVVTGTVQRSTAATGRAEPSPTIVPRGPSGAGGGPAACWRS